MNVPSKRRLLPAQFSIIPQPLQQLVANLALMVLTVKISAYKTRLLRHAQLVFTHWHMTSFARRAQRVITV